MAYVLIVATFQLGHPVLFFVQMKAGYFSFHKLQCAT